MTNTAYLANELEFKARGFYEIDKLKHIALLVTHWKEAEMKDKLK